MEKIRVFILLVILAVVIIQSLQDKADLNWKNSFYVAVYPVNVENNPQVEQYIQHLTAADFVEASEFLNSEARRYGVPLYRPINIVLGKPISQLPPAPPVNGGIIEIMLWSLKLRYFAWRNEQDFSIHPQIQLYLLYFDPKQHRSLSHSTALQKGRVGRVNLFGEASYSQQNLVILSHELLHTLGANDKYDFANNMPAFPDGYGNPQQQPLFPQAKAELMGGRLVINESKAVIPKNLAQTVIGPKTAREIGWVN
ncbi:hypothetical protein [Alkanindiges illinoisensis]|uniref:hypothetical protein n=1 Tax=Alkanindiges illinoisensis TaxID=197183 RepID=UPI000551C637|nr:hypothetical protein [Alkanindiges illinoisensis]